MADRKEIGLEMGVETVETPKDKIDEREGNHRGRRAWDKKHRGLVDEIAVGKLLPNSSGIACSSRGNNDCRTSGHEHPERLVLEGLENVIPKAVLSLVGVAITNASFRYEFCKRN
jgi:hypothetical protein